MCFYFCMYHFNLSWCFDIGGRGYWIPRIASICHMKSFFACDVAERVLGITNDFRPKLRLALDAIFNFASFRSLDSEINDASYYLPSSTMEGITRIHMYIINNGTT